MRKKDLKVRMEFVAGDNTLLRELLHPDRDGVDVPYSIAYARLLPGKESLPHRLKAAEVYIILRGRGIAHIGGTSRKVTEGNVVHIPANSAQFIKNSGKSDLEFLCIVSPPWRAEDEETLQQKPG